MYGWILPTFLLILSFSSAKALLEVSRMLHEETTKKMSEAVEEGSVGSNIESKKSSIDYQTKEDNSLPRLSNYYRIMETSSKLSKPRLGSIIGRLVRKYKKHVQPQHVQPQHIQPQNIPHHPCCNNHPQHNHHQDAHSHDKQHTHEGHEAKKPDIHHCNHKVSLPEPQPLIVTSNHHHENEHAHHHHSEVRHGHVSTHHHKAVDVVGKKDSKNKTNTLYQKMFPKGFYLPRINVINFTPPTERSIRNAKNAKPPKVSSQRKPEEDGHELIDEVNNDHDDEKNGENNNDDIHPHEKDPDHVIENGDDVDKHDDSNIYDPDGKEVKIDDKYVNVNQNLTLKVNDTSSPINDTRAE